MLTHLSLTDRKATSCDLKKAFEDATGAVISSRTVRRELLKSGLRGCVAAKKLQLLIAKNGMVSGEKALVM